MNHIPHIQISVLFFLMQNPRPFISTILTFMFRSAAFILRTNLVNLRSVGTKPLVCGQGGVAQIRAMRDSNGRVVRKENLPRKVCIACGRDFTWRKKWENCWDEVTCCSKRCRSEAKKVRNAANRQASDDSSSEYRRGESSKEKRKRKKSAR